MVTTAREPMTGRERRGHDRAAANDGAREKMDNVADQGMTTTTRKEAAGTVGDSALSTRAVWFGELLLLLLLLQTSTAN